MSTLAPKGDESNPPCPWCGEELIAMLGSLGCPLTQAECTRRAEAARALESQAPDVVES